VQAGDLQALKNLLSVKGRVDIDVVIVLDWYSKKIVGKQVRPSFENRRLASSSRRRVNQAIP